jgi:hypothetical protein
VTNSFSAALYIGLASVGVGPAQAQSVAAATNAACFEARLAPNTLATAFIEDFPEQAAYSATTVPLPRKPGSTLLCLDGMPTAPRPHYNGDLI